MRRGNLSWCFAPSRRRSFCNQARSNVSASDCHRETCPSGPATQRRNFEQRRASPHKCVGDGGIRRCARAGGVRPPRGCLNGGDAAQMLCCRLATQAGSSCVAPSQCALAPHRVTFGSSTTSTRRHLGGFVTAPQQNSWYENAIGLSLYSTDFWSNESQRLTLARHGSAWTLVDAASARGLRAKCMTHNFQQCL